MQISIVLERLTQLPEECKEGASQAQQQNLNLDPNKYMQTYIVDFPQASDLDAEINKKSITV